MWGKLGKGMIFFKTTIFLQHQQRTGNTEGYSRLHPKKCNLAFSVLGSIFLIRYILIFHRSVVWCIALFFNFQCSVEGKNNKIASFQRWYCEKNGYPLIFEDASSSIFFLQKKVTGKVGGERKWPSMIFSLESDQKISTMKYYII